MGGVADRQDRPLTTLVDPPGSDEGGLEGRNVLSPVVSVVLCLAGGRSSASVEDREEGNRVAPMRRSKLPIRCRLVSSVPGPLGETRQTAAPSFQIVLSARTICSWGEVVRDCKVPEVGGRGQEPADLARVQPARRSRCAAAGSGRRGARARAKNIINKECSNPHQNPFSKTVSIVNQEVAGSSPALV
jgi:hypothetical protein